MGNWLIGGVGHTGLMCFWTSEAPEFDPSTGVPRWIQRHLSTCPRDPSDCRNGVLSLRLVVLRIRCDLHIVAAFGLTLGVRCKRNIRSVVTTWYSGEIGCELSVRPRGTRLEHSHR